MAFVLGSSILLAGVGLYFNRSNSIEQNRLKQIEVRDRWIAGTIASLEGGRSGVHLYSCINSDLMLEKIAWMEEVQSVTFEQTIDLTENGIQSLVLLPNLRELAFRGEGALTDETIWAVAKCKNLQILCIKSSSVTDAGLAAIETMSALEEFSHCGQFTPKAIEQLLNKMPHLNVTTIEY